MKKRIFREERSENEICLSKTLELIRMGGNSEKMLYDKLTKRGFSKESIAYSLEKAKENRLINDLTLFERHADYLARRKKFGPYRIKAELILKFGKEFTALNFENVIEDIDFRLVAHSAAYKERSKEDTYIAAKLKRLGHMSGDIIYAVKNKEKEIDCEKDLDIY